MRTETQAAISQLYSFNRHSPHESGKGHARARLRLAGESASGRSAMARIVASA